jgi:hypothetical protein
VLKLKKCSRFLKIHILKIQILKYSISKLFRFEKYSNFINMHKKLQGKIKELAEQKRGRKKSDKVKKNGTGPA